MRCLAQTANFISTVELNVGGWGGWGVGGSWNAEEKELAIFKPSSG